MGETLNLQFQRREDGSVEILARESWSGHTVRGGFAPPYNARKLRGLLKKLNTQENSEHELIEIGHRLFLALCGASARPAQSSAPAPSVPSVPSSASEKQGLTPGVNVQSAEHSVQAMLRSVIQRTLRRRGTVALTLIFSEGCEEFVGYPWELLHNGEHFLLVSGIFTLTRALLLPDLSAQAELPVYPPLRLLYIGASPIDLPPLELETSFESLRRGLRPLIDERQLEVNRLEPPTYDELVRYLNAHGGAGALNDQDNTLPCYAVHFDGHGAFGRLCQADDCDELNDSDARVCRACKRPLGKAKAQTFLCFCNNEGRNHYISTESLRELFVSTDVRLAVFSACDTAHYIEDRQRQQRRAAVDASLAMALVRAQVPAVVAMPFSIQDDLSPTFMYHFYDAIAAGRTLEEALERARQAMLPIKVPAWFVPVLYRHVVEGQIGPVPLLANENDPQTLDHPLAHMGATGLFVGRDREIEELSAFLESAVQGDARKARPVTHHVALTGPTGIGKSELAFEVARRNAGKFSGGITGISLQAGKTLGDALIEMAHALHIHSKSMNVADVPHCERTVLNAYRGLANRNLACLLMLDGFEEIEESADVGHWYRFLCALPEQVIALLTSRSNPFTVAVLEGAACHWYEYPVGKMTSEDILKLFASMASGSGLDERIHLFEPEQQAVLQEIGTLLDGYPLGAQLIFGAARTIHGRIVTPEAATRSLEEIRDELRDAMPEGMSEQLDIAYRRLSPAAQQLLPYLSAFTLPFSLQQIVALFSPETPAAARAARRLELEPHLLPIPAVDTASMHVSGAGVPPFTPAGTKSSRASDVARVDINRPPFTPAETKSSRASDVAGVDINIPPELAKNWRAARDELVRTSFIQFDGRVYTIHTQVRHFALAHLQEEQRKQVYRAVAAFYGSQPQPGPDEWFAAFQLLEDAGEPHDLHRAIHLIVRAAWALRSRGHAAALRAMLLRAEGYALSLGDVAGEARVQFCLGAILRQLGKYAEALGCLTRSLDLYRYQNERDEEAWALFELAMLFREEGQYSQAQQHAQDAMRLFREAGDARGEAWMQLVLGDVSRGHGDYYGASGHYDRALATFRSLVIDDGVASALRRRGTVHEANGDYAQALVDYEESLRLFSSLGERIEQALVMTDQGIVYLDLAHFEEAQQLCTEAIAIFREQGARRGEGRALRTLGDVARKQGRIGEARALYNQSLAIFNDLGDRVDAAHVKNAQGAISLAEGDYAQAKEFFEQARALANQQEARQVEGHALRGMGDVARLMRHYNDADHYYAGAAAIARQLDTPAERSAVLYRQGMLHATQEHYQQALETWAEVLFQDHRADHPERLEHEASIAAFVAEHHLEESYAALRKQYGLI
jgi:tetratricopeptide (TPR) repeat protein